MWLAHVYPYCLCTCLCAIGSAMHAHFPLLASSPKTVVEACWQLGNNSINYILLKLPRPAMLRLERCTHVLESARGDLRCTADPTGPIPLRHPVGGLLPTYARRPSHSASQI